MGRGWSLEYDKNLPRFLLHLSHWSDCFQLLLLSQSSRSLRRCCFLPQTLRYLMNRLILTGQASGLGLRSPTTDSQLHQERKEVTHKRNQLHICRWSMTDCGRLNSHSLSPRCRSSGLGPAAN